MWAWPSIMPGMTVLPRNSMTRVRLPIRVDTPASVPTAVNLPPAKASALATDERASMVRTRPPRMTTSSPPPSMAAVIIAWRYRQPG